MVETKLLKVAVLGTSAVISCEGRKLRGHDKEVSNRKLGRFWIPGDASNGSGYSIYTGISNDFAPLRTNTPTKRPSKKPTNEPTTWMGDAYPTLSPTLK